MFVSDRFSREQPLRIARGFGAQIPFSPGLARARGERFLPLFFFS